MSLLFVVTQCVSAMLTGGLRKASAIVSGQEVYRHLKFESGVHRVQRVPQTEKSGRIHTSTMTVAVLPQPSEVCHLHKRAHLASE